MCACVFGKPKSLDPLAYFTMTEKLGDILHSHMNYKDKAHASLD